MEARPRVELGQAAYETARATLLPRVDKYSPRSPRCKQPGATPLMRLRRLIPFILRLSPKQDIIPGIIKVIIVLVPNYDFGSERSGTEFQKSDKPMHLHFPVVDSEA